MAPLIVAAILATIPRMRAWYQIKIGRKPWLVSIIVSGFTSVLLTIGVLWLLYPKLHRVQSGSIIAFDLRKCPVGWTTYQAAKGKFILGAGKGILEVRKGKDAPPKKKIDLTNRGFWEQGGEEKHKLKIPEMPSHDHDVIDPRHDHNQVYGQIREGTRGYREATSVHPQGQDERRSQPSKTKISLEKNGHDVAHNNMPPFIALTFCKFD